MFVALITGGPNYKIKKASKSRIFRDINYELLPHFEMQMSGKVQTKLIIYLLKFTENFSTNFLEQASNGGGIELVVCTFLTLAF